MHLSQTSLIRLAAGELPPDEQQEAERHLGACAPCRQAFEGVRDVRDVLSEWSIDCASRDTWEGIERALDDRAVIRPTWAWGRRLSRIAAAIALGVGTGYGAGWLAKPHGTHLIADLPVASADEALAAVGFDAIESPSATGLFSVMTPESADELDAEATP
ncbi:MAG: zf-HC2 domain-containing protein [Phycisphaerales bacterium]|nr:zf-HC2 domain-containing protein [Phycisphaerales bacterium]MCB9857223.1 zf-HC2 domain-containing protein [Phycisphaerales bacterium]MCB9863063.1 zf-HC2 domain-containing protein [Phycisphaerales bacterium]